MVTQQRVHRIIVQRFDPRHGIPPVPTHPRKRTIRRRMPVHRAPPGKLDGEFTRSHASIIAHPRPASSGHPRPMIRPSSAFRLLTLAGILAFAAGIITGPGVPTQDPSPEQQLAESRAYHRSDILCLTGLALLGSGLSGVLILRLAALLRQPPK